MTSTSTEERRRDRRRPDGRGHRAGLRRRRLAVTVDRERRPAAAAAWSGCRRADRAPNAASSATSTGAILGRVVHGRRAADALPPAPIWWSRRCPRRRPQGPCCSPSPKAVAGDRPCSPATPARCPSPNSAAALRRPGAARSACTSSTRCRPVDAGRDRRRARHRRRRRRRGPGVGGRRSARPRCVVTRLPGLRDQPARRVPRPRGDPDARGGRRRRRVDRPGHGTGLPPPDGPAAVHRSGRPRRPARHRRAPARRRSASGSRRPRCCATRSPAANSAARPARGSSPGPDGHPHHNQQEARSHEH